MNAAPTLRHIGTARFAICGNDYTTYSNGTVDMRCGRNRTVRVSIDKTTDTYSVRRIAGKGINERTLAEVHGLCADVLADWATELSKSEA